MAFWYFFAAGSINIKKASWHSRVGFALRRRGVNYQASAHFLFQHGQLTSAPEYILFNGGAMKPAIFQQAIVESIAKWYDGTKPVILKNSSLDLSVSRGATYYAERAEV